MGPTASLKNRVRKLEQAKYDDSAVGAIVIRPSRGRGDEAEARSLVHQMRARSGFVYIANLAGYDLGLSSADKWQPPKEKP